jgi:hypothetical protein
MYLKNLKFLFRNVFATALCLILLLTMSCKEKENPEPVPEPILPPAVLNSKIFKSIYPAENETIAISDSIVISFNESFYKMKLIGTVYYRAIIAEIIIPNVASATIRDKDSLSVTLYPKNMLKGNTTFQVSIKTHWEVFENIWKIATWQGAELRENLVSNFTTLAAPIKIENSNIEYLYPIPNQYHFLKDEYPSCFIKLKRGQESLFTLNGYTYAALFIDSDGVVVERAVTYEAGSGLIKFSVPPTLEAESIYNLKLMARPANANQTTLISYHFRTSKYKTFAEKFSAVTYSSSRGGYVTDDLHDQPIYKRITGMGEFFDSFETEKKSESFSYDGRSYNVNYSSGLVRIEAVMQGTDWYDKQIYPFLYAPWTDSNFKPTLVRSTSTISSPPVEAMYFSDCGIGMLTPAIVASNGTPAIFGGARPEIIWRLELTIYNDFLTVRKQVLTRYPNFETNGQRENKVLSTLFPTLDGSIFKYQVKYVLPSGVVTSIVSSSLNY